MAYIPEQGDIVYLNLILKWDMSKKEKDLHWLLAITLIINLQKWLSYARLLT